MMIEYYVGTVYQKYLTNPFAKQLKNYTRLSPTFLTFMALFSGILSAGLLIFAHPVWASLLLLLSGYLDSLDGTLARITNCVSEKGAVLDIVFDRMVEFLVIFALFYIDPVHRAMPAMWMLGSSFICVTSFLVVGIFMQNSSNKSFHYSVGLMERLEAFIFFIAMMLIPKWFVSLAWIYTALVFMTAIHRVYVFFQTDLLGGVNDKNNS